MVANRPEIKIYPVHVEYYPGPIEEHCSGDQSAYQSSRRDQNWRSPGVERYLRGLVGKTVRVHTSSAGQIRGVLEAVLSEAIVIRTERGQVLVHDWAIETIESE